MVDALQIIAGILLISAVFLVNVPWLRAGRFLRAHGRESYPMAPYLNYRILCRVARETTNEKEREGARNILTDMRLTGWAFLLVVVPLVVVGLLLMQL